MPKGRPIPPVTVTHEQRETLKHRARRPTHDYIRHGTTTLFTALAVHHGRIMGGCHARHPCP